jgi:hypothetical protein
MSNFPLGSISPLAVARTAAGGFAVLGLTMGINCLTTPQAFVRTFGFSPRSPTFQNAESNPFVRISGGRAMTPGIGMLIFLALGYDKALGVTMMISPLVGIIDGLCLWTYTEQECELESKTETKTGAVAELRDTTRYRRVQRARQTATAHVVTTCIIALVGSVLAVYGER